MSLINHHFCQVSIILGLGGFGTSISLYKRAQHFHLADFILTLPFINVDKVNIKPIVIASTLVGVLGRSESTLQHSNGESV